MKEYEIGHEFEYNGKTLVVIESPTPSCAKCFFSKGEHCLDNGFVCGGFIREDFTNVIFIEKDAI